MVKVNKVVFYLASRYFTYFVQFMLSLVIAAKLTPYFMGIWGGVLLLINYFQQIHLGIANSLNVLLVHNKDNADKSNKYILNSLVLISGLSLLAFLFFLYYYYNDIPALNKYHIRDYVGWLCVIVILQYFNMLFMNILRIRNKLLHISFFQSIVVLLNLSCVFFFSGEELIYWLVIGYAVGNILCVVCAFLSGIIPIAKFDVDRIFLKEILIKGLYLFLFNSCFYFIIISIRTIISYFYSVQEFGFFTFSFTLAHAILLLLESLAFVIYPKIIHKLSANDTNAVKSLLAKLRKSYISSAHLLVYVSFCFFPILIYYMPKYQEAWQSFNLIALSVLMNTNSFGFSTLLIARNKEKYVAIISFIALLLNICGGLLLVNVFNVTFSYVIMATLFTYLVFSTTCIFVGYNLLDEVNIKHIIRESFPIRLWIPYIFAIGLALGSYQTLTFLPLFLFLICNWKDIIYIYATAKRVILHPDTLNF